MASIVEQEQDKKIDERPKIARLYLNRLNNPSLFPYLQADPTVKFANKDFGIKQLLNKHTRIHVIILIKTKDYLQDQFAYLLSMQLMLF